MVVSITAAGRRRLVTAPQPPTVQLIAALRRLAPRERRGLVRHLSALLGAMGLADEPATMLFEEQGAARRRARA
ncbi:MAG: hypothetical protein JF589_03870 [Gemmatimonadetes bacterium]|nr:hypothetical protein [Gemmatimonadota bacterium]